MKRYYKAGVERHLYDKELKIYGGKTLYTELIQGTSIRSILQIISIIKITFVDGGTFSPLLAIVCSNFGQSLGNRSNYNGRV